MHLELSSQVMDIYHQIDQETREFQHKTGLSCPPGCGQCCTSPDIEATPLDLLPLVVELFRQNTAQYWLTQAEKSDSTGDICVFYAPDPLIPGHGRCHVYPWRPTLCRLFGFAAVQGKLGNPELSVCARHKDVMPTIAAQAQQAVAEGLPVPIIADVARRVAHLDPQRSERMPINQALRVAIETVGLYMQFNSNCKECCTDELST